MGILFSGAAFIAIALTLIYQRRELHGQREELHITREELSRTSEIALRQLHNDLIKLAINDRDLRRVWPHMAPGVASTKQDYYVNLILNLQKVAYEADTIKINELRGSLLYLMSSPDVYSFWK